MKLAGLLWFWLALALTLPGAEFVIHDASPDGIGLERFFWAAGQSGAPQLPEELEIVLTKNAEKNQADAVAMELALGDKIPDGMAAARLARYPVLVAVSAENPIAQLPAETLRKIFTGQIRSWDAVGGFEGSILRAGVKENTPAGRAFRKFIMGQDITSRKTPLPGHDILPGIIWLNSPDFAKALAAARNVILFGGWELAQTPGLKVLAIGEVAPTYENIESGRYLYQISHVLVYRKDAPPAAIEKVAKFFQAEAFHAGALPAKKPATAK